MASKDDGEISNTPALEWMKCNICLDKFSQPRVLPCLHTFCQTCLQRHVDFYCSAESQENSDNFNEGYHSRSFNNYGSHAYNDESFIALRDRLANMSSSSLSESTWRNYRKENKTFPCPSCREKVTLPEIGINGFRHDFRVSQLQDWMESMKERTDKLEKENKKRTKQKKRTQTVTNNKEVTCWCHPKEVLIFICIDCSTGICKCCTKEEHKNHKITTIRDGMELYRDSMQSLCTALSVRSTQLQKVSEKLHVKERDIFTQENKLLEKIREMSEEAIKAVREEEKKLILELKDRSRSNALSIKNIKNQVDRSRENMETVREYSMSALDGQLSPDLTTSYQDLVTQMDTILEESLLLGAGDVKVTPLQFIKAKSKIKLGKLKHKEQYGSEEIIDTDGDDPEVNLSPRNVNGTSKKSKKSIRNGKETLTLSSQPNIQQMSSFGKLGSELGNFNSPSDICFLSSLEGRPNSESFIVADTNNNRLQIFNMNGTFIKVIGEGKIKPWAVTVNRQGNIVITDTLDKCIKIFDTDGRCLHKFGKFLCPCGIAVNSEGNFIVTDFFSASVYVSDITGRVLHKFDFRTDSDDHMSGHSHICISPNDTLFISDISNNCIKLFDCSGNLLQQTRCQDVQMSSNSGICFDKVGNIFIVDSLASKITILNRKGELISHIDLKNVMDSPRREKPQHNGNDLLYNGNPSGIAISPHGHLALTCSKSNQVHVYKLANKRCTLLLKLPAFNQRQKLNGKTCPLQTVQF